MLVSKISNYNFSPLKLNFTLQHPSEIDARRIFNQYPSEVSELDSGSIEPDCIVELIKNENHASTEQLIYPELVDETQVNATGDSFTSYFDRATVHWLHDGRSRVEISLPEYESSPHYLQNLILKSFRHALLPKGYLVVHSSACKFHNSGFLVIGKQNTGKSTFSVLAGTLGGQVVSDDMMIIGNFNNSVLNGRAAREEIVLREAMATTLFSNNIDSFKKSRYYPSNETKYVLSRQNDIVNTEIITTIDKVLIATDSNSQNKKHLLKTLAKNQSFALLIDEICGQYDSPINQFRSNRKLMLTGISKLNSLPVFKYAKSSEFATEPVGCTRKTLDVLTGF